MLGFLALAALRSVGVIGPELAAALDTVARVFVLVALAGIGASTKFRELRETSWRPILPEASSASHPISKFPFRPIPKSIPTARPWKPTSTRSKPKPTHKPDQNRPERIVMAISPVRLNHAVLFVADLDRSVPRSEEVAVLPSGENVRP